MIMLDALYPDSIPLDTPHDYIAAYIDHHANPQSYAQARKRFPNSPVFTIATQATTPAQILDCGDVGDATPAQSPGWVRLSRAAGIPDPIVYCNQLNDWPTVQRYMVGTLPPLYWVARYDGDPTIPPGTWGKQFTDNKPKNLYDTSVVGVYPLPSPPDPPQPEDDDMQLGIITADPDGQHVWIIDPWMTSRVRIPLTDEQKIAGLITLQYVYMTAPLSTDFLAAISDRTVYPQSHPAAVTVAPQ